MTRPGSFVPAGRPPGLSSLRLTLKAWPAIAFATIGLCFLTKTVAGWMGIDLPDQENVAVVKQFLERAFASPRHFAAAALLVAQVVALLPIIEELVFRGLLFRIPTRLFARRSTLRLFDYSIIALSSLLFSAAHYIAQPWPDAAFLALFFFGVAQCALYRKTGRIWCAMLNHGLFNLTNLLLLFVLPEA